jgi:urocanate hydratase|tara:strand:- start:55 stop:543 length:489 start_codon:yes stop_codon:yes gene_type:complete
MLNNIIDLLDKLQLHQMLLVERDQPIIVIDALPNAPKVLMTKSALNANWARQPDFDQLKHLGLMLYGQINGGSWVFLANFGSYKSFVALDGQADDDYVAVRWVITCQPRGDLRIESHKRSLAAAETPGLTLMAHQNPQVRIRLPAHLPSPHWLLNIGNPIII